MLLTEYDEQRHIASEKEISRREGHMEGRTEGILEKAKEVAVNLIKRIHCGGCGLDLRRRYLQGQEWHREWKAAKRMQMKQIWLKWGLPHWIFSGRLL